jgi:hypothetical protein
VKGDAVFVRPSDRSAGCDLHAWPTDGLARRLIQAMRDTHGKGGVNACIACIKRAKADAAEKAGIRPLPDGIYHGRRVKDGSCRPWCGGQDPACPVHGQSS